MEQNTAHLELSEEQKKQIEQTPWNIQFSYKEKSIKITLKNAEDILKLGESFNEWLLKSGIETVTEKKYL